VGVSPFVLNHGDPFDGPQHTGTSLKVDGIENYEGSGGDIIPLFVFPDGVTDDDIMEIFPSSKFDYDDTLATLTVDSTGARLEILGGATIPGDANDSGFVDDDDLAVLLSNWEQDPGTITTWALGDFTDDTDVDDDDLAVLLGNWTGPAPPGGAAVPEPVSAALLLIGAPLAALRRRRRSCPRATARRKEQVPVEDDEENVLNRFACPLWAGGTA